MSDTSIPNFVLEQELDELTSWCSQCHKVHGPEACNYSCECCGEDPCIYEGEDSDV